MKQNIFQQLEYNKEIVSLAFDVIKEMNKNRLN